MSSHPFADHFIDTQKSCIEHDGELLHSIVEIPLVGPCSFTVTRVTAHSDRPEGLVLDAESSRLTVGNRSETRLTLWSDTAPERVEIELTDEGPIVLRAWNTWRDAGVEHAWVGWAAIRRRDHDGIVTLECNDGHPSTDFDDLVVELRTDRVTPAD